MNKLILLVVFFLLLQAELSTASTGELYVFHVKMNHSSPLETGLEIGEQAKEAFPEIEKQYDAWLAELFTPAHFTLIRQRYLPRLLKTMSQPFREELQGVANAWTLTQDSRPGDGQLSLAEYQVLNLLPDLGLAPDGIGLGAFGSVATGRDTIVGHNMEWQSAHLIRDLQSITVYYSENGVSFVTIGIAGMVTALQGFNQYGVFAALINALPYSPYPLNKVISDRNNLQLISDTIRQVLKASSSTKKTNKLFANKYYLFPYSILLADNKNIQVMEYSPQQRSKMRYWDSQLHYGMPWEKKQQIASIDCLLLASMPDTCKDAKDRVRWKRLNTLVNFDSGLPATPESIGEILLDRANKHYELLNEDTLLSLYFLPRSNTLYAFIPQKNNDRSIHNAYLNLLPHASPWIFKIKWLIWLVILLMTGILVWLIYSKNVSITGTMNDE